MHDYNYKFKINDFKILKKLNKNILKKENNYNKKNNK